MKPLPLPPKPHFSEPLIPGFKADGLKIPADYCRYQLRIPLKSSSSESLLSREGKQWRVRLLKGRFVGDGWNRFVDDNNLEVGDFLVFNHHGCLMFEVMVFDGITEMPKRFVWTDGKGIPLKQYRSTRRRSILVSPIRPDLEQVRRPHFIERLNHFQNNFCLVYFAKEFARSSGLLVQNGQISVIDELGIRSWNFELKNLAGDRVLIVPELKLGEFFTTYGFKTGDLFKFEVVAAGNHEELPVVRILSWSLKNRGRVEVISEPDYEETRRANQDKGKAVQLIGIHSSTQSDTLTDDFTMESGTGKTFRGTIISSSGSNPYFIAEVKPYCLKTQCLNIPMSFARSNGLKRSGKSMMTIIGKNNEKWLATFMTHTTNVRIWKGWKEFREANGIKLGDFIKFQIVENGIKPLVRVTVILDSILTS